MWLKVSHVNIHIGLRMIINTLSYYEERSFSFILPLKNKMSYMQENIVLALGGRLFILHLLSIVVMSSQQN